jgi:hypothetical protein
MERRRLGLEALLNTPQRRLRLQKIAKSARRQRNAIIANPLASRKPAATTGASVKRSSAQ